MTPERDEQVIGIGTLSGYTSKTQWAMELRLVLDKSRKMADSRDMQLYMGVTPSLVL